MLAVDQLYRHYIDWGLGKRGVLEKRKKLDERDGQEERCTISMRRTIYPHSLWRWHAAFR